ncbi:MAG: hypothetical protein WD250_16815 [Egibacteraceae bacterium]
MEYSARTLTEEDSWALLPADLRAWAEQVAGPPIRDWRTRAARRYRHCRVDHTAAARPVQGCATYDLWLFGKGGLAVATGTTTALDDRTGASWGGTRWARPVDGTRIRSAHLSAGRPHTGAPAGGRPDRAGLQLAAGTARYVPVDVAPYLGNLPAGTQRHLLEPFVSRGRMPERAGLHATTAIVANRYEERYSCYLFDGHWVSFAEASRGVPYASGMAGPALWHHSPESARIRHEPWQVVAWHGPVRAPANPSATSGR